MIEDGLGVLSIYSAGRFMTPMKETSVDSLPPAHVSLFTSRTVLLPYRPAPPPSVPMPALRWFLMAFSIFGDTFGRPLLALLATRSRPARTLARRIELAKALATCRTRPSLSWTRPSGCHSDAARILEHRRPDSEDQGISGAEGRINARHSVAATAPGYSDEHALSEVIEYHAPLGSERCVQ